MCGIKYGTNTAEREFNKQVWQAPIINDAFFQVRKEIREQAIKDAELAWSSQEVQDSLERNRQECKKLEESESKNNDIKLVDTKLKIVQWVMLQIRASYSWQDKS